MTKKRLILIGGLLATCICVPLGVVAMMPPRPGVTKAKFDLIQDGMTKAEVTQIFGREPIDVSQLAEGRQTWHIWLGDDGSHTLVGSYALLRFRDDKVMIPWAIWRESNETHLQKLRRWLRL